MDGRPRLRQLVRQSALLSHLAKQAIGQYESLRDRKLNREARWARRSTDELGFWADSLRAGRFTDLLDPNREVQAASLRRAIDAIPSDSVSVIDVGSGPLTAVGHVFPGKTLSIVATDALADEYVTMLDDCDLTVPVLPVACSGEALLGRFPAHSFDVAYCQNALDHSSDPMAILSNMLELVTISGRVVLNHFRNEGDRNGYIGLHFWNIDCRDNTLILWNQKLTHDVSAFLGSHGWKAECWFDVDRWGEHIHCLISPIE
jgi:SAM-dependent methyltransferase